MLGHLARIVGTSEHVDLIAACLRALEIFRLSHQLDVLALLFAGRPAREVTAQ